MTVGEYKQQIFTRNPEWRAFDSEVTSSKKLSPESYDALECCKQKCDEDEIRAAFRSLEEYALNLLRYPWKSEIKTLRPYSGYFHMRVARIVDNPSPLLAKLGYHDDHGIYKLTDEKSSDDLLSVAADFRAASLLVEYEDVEPYLETPAQEVEDMSPTVNNHLECNEKLIVDLPPPPPPQLSESSYADDIEMKEAGGDNISIASDITRGHEDIPTEPIHKPPPRKPANDSMENMEAFYQNVDEVDRNLNHHLNSDHYQRGGTSENQHQPISSSTSQPQMATFRQPSGSSSSQYTTDAVVHSTTNTSEHMVRGESLNCMASAASRGMQANVVSRSESMDGLPKPWPCSRCTYSNKPCNDVCEVCETARFS